LENEAGVLRVVLAAVKMDFHYDDRFPKEPNVGYET
jgi:glucose-6-phosphate 1-dehydrogenase